MFWLGLIIGLVIGFILCAILLALSSKAIDDFNDDMDKYWFIYYLCYNVIGDSSHRFIPLEKD